MLELRAEVILSARSSSKPHGSVLTAETEMAVSSWPNVLLSRALTNNRVIKVKNAQMNSRTVAVVRPGSVLPVPVPDMTGVSDVSDISEDGSRLT